MLYLLPQLRDFFSRRSRVHGVGLQGKTLSTLGLGCAF
jgi:hypothetical protein